MFRLLSTRKIAFSIASCLTGITLTNTQSITSKPQFELKLSAKELEEWVSREKRSRHIENILASSVCTTLILGDLFLLTGTGLIGGTISLGLLTGYVYTHLIPVNDEWHTHMDNTSAQRLRFIDTSDEQLVLMGLQEALELERHKIILPSSHRLSQRLQTVGHYLASKSELQLPAGQDWSFHVLDEPAVNALVLPSGQVFVNRGLFELIGHSDEELSVVLAHEFAHLGAKHQAERLSMARFPAILKWTYSLISVLTGTNFMTNGIFADRATELFLTLPFSRLHEEEADVLSLQYLIRAGIHPSQALNFWSRMEERDRMLRDKAKQLGPVPGQRIVFEMFSTHPSSEARLQVLRTIMPKANRRFEERWTRPF